MLSLIKQVFIVLLGFSSSLATKCLSLNDELCMTRPFLIDLNPAELKYYLFMVSLDKCSGSYNSLNDLSIKICVSSKRKDINVKAFNITTRINEAKTLVKHISCNCKYKCNSKTCNSDQKWNNEQCQRECKNHSLNPRHIFVKMVSIFKKMAYDPEIVCDETIYVMDSVLIKMTNTRTTNVTSTVSMRRYNEKVRYKIDCYILHTVLLVITLLLIIAIIYYHYAKHRLKQKNIDALIIQKWRIMNFKNFILKIVRVIISMT